MKPTQTKTIRSRRTAPRNSSKKKLSCSPKAGRFETIQEPRILPPFDDLNFLRHLSPPKVAVSWLSLFFFSLGEIFHFLWPRKGFDFFWGFSRVLGFAGGSGFGFFGRRVGWFPARGGAGCRPCWSTARRTTCSSARTGPWTWRSATPSIETQGEENRKIIRSFSVFCSCGFLSLLLYWLRGVAFVSGFCWFWWGFHLLFSPSWANSVLSYWRFG